MFKKKIVWEKLGLIIKPQKKLWFQKTHSMIPTPEYLSSNKIKVYLILLTYCFKLLGAQLCLGSKTFLHHIVPNLNVIHKPINKYTHMKHTAVTLLYGLHEKNNICCLG